MGLRFLFTRRQVQPPSSLYVSESEGLLLTVSSFRLDAFSVELQARMLFSDGQTGTLRFSTPVQAFTRQSFTFAIPEGFILGLTARVTNNTQLFYYGEVFCTVALAVGLTATPYPTQVLIGAYISKDNVASWPGGTIIPPCITTTEIRSIPFSSPGVGVEISAVLPGAGESYRLTSLIFTLATSAVAGNRNVLLRWRINQGGPIHAQVGANVAQPPSTTWAYTVGPFGYTGQVGPLDVVIGIVPDLWSVQPNFVIETFTRGLDVADQYTVIAASGQRRVATLG